MDVKDVSKALAITMLLIGAIMTTPVETYASESQIEASLDNVEAPTLNTKLESTKEQTSIKGNETQLSKVNLDTMKFIKEIAFSANQSGQEYGLYPSITIAQAVLESGGGKSGLSQAPHHNLFGVKGSYEGRSAQMKTKEDNGSGSMFEIYANFKSYPDWGESLKDHNELLRYGLNGFYHGTWRENASTPRQAAEYLQGRYATDTNYASKLINIIEIYNLERFDKQLDSRDLAWLASDSLDPWEIFIIEKYECITVST